MQPDGWWDALVSVQASPKGGEARPRGNPLRIRYVLPGAAAAVVAAASIALAVPALAETSPAKSQPVKVEKATTQPAKSTQQGAGAAGEKYPGDPYAGKCAYVLTGETQVRDCSTRAPIPR
jgi:hypothetical protein